MFTSLDVEYVPEIDSNTVTPAKAGVHPQLCKKDNPASPGFRRAPE